MKRDISTDMPSINMLLLERGAWLANKIKKHEGELGSGLTQYFEGSLGELDRVRRMVCGDLSVKEFRNNLTDEQFRSLLSATKANQP